MAIEGAILLATAFGFIVAILISNAKLGCASLLIVPVAMIFQISRWQDQNPEAIRSTSGLDFLFVPFWPIIAALCGFAVGLILRKQNDES
ncbi:hypothetical protein [Parasphingorhabdus sp.]|uniref:hypothetical protein n=1 Tax=Parasphingorhabdus sp. TaxID=2709688 RepID=UPI003002D9AE